MVDRWVLGAYKSLDENDRVDHIDASTNSLNGKNDTRLKQTENKEKKNNIEINSQTRKYDLSTAQATIDEMRLKYRNSFLTNCKVSMNRGIAKIKFKRNFYFILFNNKTMYRFV